MRLTPLYRTIQYENKNQEYEGVKHIPYNQILFATQQEGFLFSNFMNSSLSFVDDPHCPKGKFIYDPRCRFWYFDTLPETSFKIHSPKISIGKVESYLSQMSCQKFQKYNSHSMSEEVNHVICIESMLSPIKDYFQNIVRASKQWYIIDPRTQAIIYNSENKQQIKNVDYFSQVELDYLESKEEAKKFNKTINTYFNKWVEDSFQSGDIQEIYSRNSKLKVFPYNRNGTQFKVILSPVIVFDRLPQIFGKQFDKHKVTQVEIAYLQMNIISNEDLYDQTNELIRFFKTIYIVVMVILIIMGLLSLLIIIFYSIKIKNLLQAPIEHLVDILKRIQINEDLSELHQILSEYEQNAEEIFLSQETRELYKCFYEVFQILLVTSENYFSENQTKTLVRLCKNINFFKQFENVHAVGITYNNTGNILLNQQHYFQALEHFSTSIIYAKYEIQNYCKNNPNTLLSLNLNQFCYNHDNKDQNEIDLNRFQSLGGIQEKISIHQKSNFYRKEEKTNSKQLSELRTDLLQASEQTNANNFDEKSNNFFESCGQNGSRSPLKKLIQSHENKQTHSHDKLINQCEINGKVIQQDQQCDQQTIELLSNLFYRKQNYIMALIAFQEHLDQNIKLAQGTLQYNFWHEIKQLLKEVLNILKYLPSSETLEATIMTQLSKCYFKINIYDKADKYLQKSSNILKLVQSEKQCNNKRKVSTPNKNSQSYIRNSLKKNDNQINNLKINDLFSINENARFVKESKCQNQNKFSSFLSPQNSEQQFFNKKDSSSQIKSVAGSFNYIYVKSINFINKTPLTISKRQIVHDQSIIQKNENFEVDKSFINLEQIFNYKRKTRKKQNNQIFNYKIPLEILKQIINFTKAEYLIHQKYFKSAAEELTNILENSKVFMSHYPYRIIHKLKNIFDFECIHSKEFNDIQNKFNSHSSAQIALILDCNNDDISVLQSLQLISDLISSILIHSKDKICIVLFNDLIQQYMQLINPLQIKQIINHIILDLYSLISTKNLQDIIPKINNLDTSYHGISDSNILSEESSQTQSNIMTNVNEDFDDLDIQDMIASCEKINKLNMDNHFKTLKAYSPCNQTNLDDICQIQQSLNNQICNKSKKIDLDNSNNQITQQQKNMQYLKVSDIYFYEESKIKSKTFDLTNDNSLKQLKITKVKSSEYLTSSCRQQINKNKNYNFHLSIRKAIKQLQANNIKYLNTDFQQQNSIFKNNLKKQQNTFKDYLQNQQNTQQNDYQSQNFTQRYIIYSTNQIEIIKNDLFDSLTSLLFKLKIKLLIISGKKGNNFLEQLMDQTYLIENEEIIKIFYTNYKINQYLISKRDSITKYVYSTYIQHF